jgi:hypothetical protein
MHPDSQNSILVETINANTHLTPFDYGQKGGQSSRHLLDQAQDFEPKQKLGVEKPMNKIGSLVIEGCGEKVLEPEAAGVRERGQNGRWIICVGVISQV